MIVYLFPYFVNCIYIIQINSDMTDLKDTKLNGKYAISQKLGSGSFGDIYLVTTSNGEIMAAKMV